MMRATGLVARFLLRALCIACIDTWRLCLLRREMPLSLPVAWPFPALTDAAQRRFAASTFVS
jgi:hypothetical protein